MKEPDWLETAMYRTALAMMAVMHARFQTAELAAALKDIEQDLLALTRKLQAMGKARNSNEEPVR